MIPGDARSRGSVSTGLGVFFGLVAGLTGVASAQTYEGYGNISVGGAGGSVYHVTSLANSGAGTLRDGVVNRSGPRIIVFDVGGTITLTSNLDINQPFLTIDGDTAPSPGITVNMGAATVGVTISGTHDVILRQLRFQGTWVPPDDTDFGPLLAIDGDSNPDHVAQRIVLDHLTLHGGSGGAPDIWGEVRDVTVSWCVISANNHPTSLSHYPSPFQVRQRISMHHNVWAKNLERNPQVRADVRSLDHVNNVSYSWGFGGSFGYGMRIRADAGEPKVNANIVNNAFFAGSLDPDSGLVYGDQPGADASDGGPSGAPKPQGTVVTGTSLGSLWVAGNLLPPANEDQYSTVGAPLSVPLSAQVTTWPASELGFRMLPSVGMKYRSAGETQLLNEIAARFPNPPPSISIADASVNEGLTGTTVVTFTVSLSGASANPVTVSYATANGTATAGNDYEAASGALVIPPGATSASVNVAVFGDAIFEADETFTVTLSAPVNGALADAQATGTIRNDDAPGLTIDDVKVTEPVSGTTSASFTVTLAPANAGVVTVNYATANGTATAPADYTAKSGTLTFPAGATTQPVSVVVNGDGAREAGAQTFMVNLSSATGGVAIVKAQGTATIYDPGSFFTLTPCRLVDTRNATGPRGGPALSANVARTFALSGVCGIPATARALSVNVTVTGPTAAGNLRVYPAGGAVPLASNINYSANQTRANSGVFAMSASGLTVRCDQASGAVHLILDVNGYFQ